MIGAMLGRLAGGEAARVAAVLPQILPGLQAEMEDLAGLFVVDAPDILAPPPPPRGVRRLIEREAEPYEAVPAQLLEAMGAYLTGWRVDYRSSHRAGILAVPVDVLDPTELEGWETAQRAAATIGAAASFLADWTERTSTLPSALIYYLELGEPPELAPPAKRMAARTLAAGIIGTLTVRTLGDLVTASELPEAARVAAEADT